MVVVIVAVVVTVAAVAVVVVFAIIALNVKERIKVKSWQEHIAKFSGKNLFLRKKIYFISDGSNAST